MSPKRLGVMVKQLRQKRGLTQEALAKKVKGHRVYIAQIEARTKTPSLGMLERLAKALKVKVTELLEKPEEGERTMPIPDWKKRKNWNQEVKRQIDLLTKVIDWTTGLQDEAEEHKDWFTARAARRVVPYLRLAEAELYDLQYFEDEESRRKWRLALDIDD